MPIANCKKCNKLYAHTGRDLCLQCLEADEAQFRMLYQTLQNTCKSGGIEITRLAEETGVSEDDIEAMYMTGRFSTAGIYLKFRCQSCDIMLNDINRKGRFCVNCSEKTATEARVEVKPLNELRKQEEKERRQQELKGLLKDRHAPSTRHSRNFGFKTNSK